MHPVRRAREHDATGPTAELLYRKVRADIVASPRSWQPARQPLKIRAPALTAAPKSEGIFGRTWALILTLKSTVQLNTESSR